MRKELRIQELPDEIVYEVLLRLSGKALSRFKLVCKVWKNLISSSPFQQGHYHLSLQNPQLLIVQYSQTHNGALDFSTYNIKDGKLLRKFSITLPKSRPSIHLNGIPSCPGLLCIQSKEEPVFLYNPCTEGLIRLPPSEEVRGFYKVGCGYVASKMEFKVFRFFDTGNETRFEVFTLGTDKWKEPKGLPNFLGMSCPTFLHGALHLLPFCCSNLMHIVAIDVDSEEYKQIPLPEYLDKLVVKSDDTRLTQLEGSLCLIFDFAFSQGRSELWLLKDYNKCNWVKCYNIDLSAAKVPSPVRRKSAQPLALLGDGTILMNVFGRTAIDLVLYDPRGKVIKQKIDNGCSVIVYAESLFSPQLMHGDG